MISDGLKSEIVALKELINKLIYYFDIIDYYTAVYSLAEYIAYLDNCDDIKQVLRGLQSELDIIDGAMYIYELTDAEREQYNQLLANVRRSIEALLRKVN